MLRRLGQMLTVLIDHHDTERAGDLLVAQLSLRLGRFRQALKEELAQELAGGRSRLDLLKLAALTAAGGRSATGEAGEGLAACGQQLRLSRAEIGHLERIEGHFADREAATLAGQPSRREIYRHYRRLDDAGLEVVLLELARFLAAQAAPPEQDAWAECIEAARQYIEPRLAGPADWLDPPPLVHGAELIDALGLGQGPMIGRLLEDIREAQAAGDVDSRKAALALARELVGGGEPTSGSDDQG